MKKRVLVTGGAGFVGSHTIDALLEAGYEVRILDNLRPQVHRGSRPSYLARDVEFIEADVRDRDTLSKAVSGVDCIFHLAAAVGVGQSMYQIADYVGTNVQGTANLLQAILDSKTQLEKLVLASSMSIYGEGRYLCLNCGVVTPPERTIAQLAARKGELQCPRCSEALRPVPTDEEKPLHCSSVYALSKKCQEEMALMFGRTYSIPVVALRYFNIYGSRQALSNPYTGVAAIFASRLMNGNAPVVFEDGQQLRDFVSVHDIVQANLLALECSNGSGMAVNVGAGTPISIGEVALAIASMLGAEMHCEIASKYRVGDVRHCFGDISRAEEWLGYRPRVSFQAGMAELVDWLRSQQSQDLTDEALQGLTNRGLVA